MNEAAFDFEPVSEVRSAYIICSTPRSGSTLLGKGLWETGLAGAPHEYFHEKAHMPVLFERWGIADFANYQTHLLKYRTSPNGVFGVKAHFDQFNFLLRQGPIDWLGLNVKYIRIRREDVVRQAISLSKAAQTGKWHSGDISEIEPVYDYADIKKRLAMILNYNGAWDRYFTDSGIVPLDIVYESFVQAYPTTILSVLSHIGAQPAPGLKVQQPSMKKQANQVTEIWFAKFQEDFSREKSRQLTTV